MSRHRKQINKVPDSERVEDWVHFANENGLEYADLQKLETQIMIWSKRQNEGGKPEWPYPSLR